MVQVGNRLREGLPYPLGASWDGAGTNFAIFSAKVEVCLFDENGEREAERVELPEYTDEIWHGYLPGIHPGAIYGYRVHGPYQPDAGRRLPFVVENLRRIVGRTAATGVSPMPA